GALPPRRLGSKATGHAPAPTARPNTRRPSVRFGRSAALAAAVALAASGCAAEQAPAGGSSGSGGSQGAAERYYLSNDDSLSESIQPAGEGVLKEAIVGLINEPRSSPQFSDPPMSQEGMVSAR